MTPENQMFWGQAVMALYPKVAYMTDWVNAWDKDNNPVEYDSALVETEANALLTASQESACKQQAMQFLSATDWVNQPDVRDPTNSPHLTNAADFDAYRLAVRQFAVYPVVDPVWPTLPVEIWA